MGRPLQFPANCGLWARRKDSAQKAVYSPLRSAGSLARVRASVGEEPAPHRCCGPKKECGAGETGEAGGDAPGPLCFARERASGGQRRCLWNPPGTCPRTPSFCCGGRHAGRDQMAAARGLRATRKRAAALLRATARPFLLLPYFLEARNSSSCFCASAMTSRMPASSISLMICGNTSAGSEVPVCISYRYMFLIAMQAFTWF